MSLVHDDTHLAEQSHCSSILEMHPSAPNKQKDPTISEEQPRVHTIVDDVNGANDISSEAVQDPLVIPLVIEVVPNKAFEETIDVDKDKWGNKYESVEEEAKEKGEKKEDPTPVTVARETILN